MSPNDADLIEYINALAMPDDRRKTAYSFPKDNSLSVVMLIKFGTDGVILGSDLENTTSLQSGWKGVVSNYYSNNKPSLIKIPHHGSSNAHNDDLWDRILVYKPFSVLTVFNNSNLPRDEDIQRISSLSQSLYVVGHRASKEKSIKTFERKVKSHLRSAKVIDVSPKIGISRFRRKINEDNWHIDTFGSVSILKSC